MGRVCGERGRAKASPRAFRVHVGLRSSKDDSTPTHPQIPQQQQGPCRRPNTRSVARACLGLHRSSVLSRTSPLSSLSSLPLAWTMGDPLASVGTAPGPSHPGQGSSLPSLCLDVWEMWGQLSPGVRGGEAEGERAWMWLNNYPRLQE